MSLGLLPGRLSRRFMAVMVLGMALGLALVFGAVAQGARIAAAEVGHAVGRGLADGPVGEACVQQGQLSLGGTARVDGFDLETLAPVTPSVPPLTEAERARALAGDLPWISSFPMLQGRGAVLLTFGASGPCSLVRLSWVPEQQARLARLSAVLGALAAGLTLCLGLGFLWVVRPLVRRIEELAGAARQVGSERPMDWPAEEADELGRIARAMRDAHEHILADKAALAEKNEALRRHVADVAHDLRTPIASLQLALERLEAGAPRTQALSDAMYLEALTDNLSLAARLREGLDAETPVTELGPVVRRVAGRLALLAEARGVALEQATPEAPLHARVHPVAFERALGNLVHNAVRYADPGGNVAVVLERQGGRFSLRVLDDGPGVPPERLPQLTDRAWRGGEARQRDATGSGLGLAITAEVCRRAGFVLRFEGLEPRGLQVCIEGSVVES